MENSGSPRDKVPKISTTYEDNGKGVVEEEVANPSSVRVSSETDCSDDSAKTTEADYGGGGGARKLTRRYSTGRDEGKGGNKGRNFMENEGDGRKKSKSSSHLGSKKKIKKSGPPQSKTVQPVHSFDRSPTIKVSSALSSTTTDLNRNPLDNTYLVSEKLLGLTAGGRELDLWQMSYEDIRKYQQEKWGDTDIQWDPENTEMVKEGSIPCILKIFANTVLKEDNNFLQSVLYTHGYFVDAYTFARILVLFYRAPIIPEDAKHQQQDVRLHIMNVFNMFMDLHFSLLEEDPKFVNLLLRFCYYLENLNDPFAVTSMKWLRRTWKVKAMEKKLAEKFRVHPLNISLGIFKFIDTDLTSIPTRLIAEQLTYREQSIKKNVDINELRHWITNQRRKAQYVAESIKWFNDNSYWVSTTIIDNGEINPKETARIIQLWIEIMKHLLDLDNYDSLHAIHLGLQQALIQQLYTAWAIVDESSMAIYQKVLQLFDHRFNFKNYRERIEKCSTRAPCIPIQSLTLRDLTFVQENATLLKTGNVNMKKMELIHKIMKDATRFKEVQYNIEEDVIIQHWITNRTIASEKELYAIAKDLLQKEKKKANILREKERKQQEKERKAKYKVEKNKLPLTFDQLTPTNNAYSSFYSWLRENLGTENIDFFNKVLQWETSKYPSEEERLQTAESIFNEYKQTLIGVSANLTKMVERNIEERNLQNLFQEIKLEVVAVLQTRYEEWCGQV